MIRPATSTAPLRKKRRFGIRLQLLLALIVLLTLPWLGYKYLHEVARFLKTGQERALHITATSVATILHNRTCVFRTERCVSLTQREANTPATSVMPDTMSAQYRSMRKSDDMLSSLPADRRQQLENTLMPLLPANMRLWVIDGEKRVLVRLGTLHRLDADVLNHRFAWYDPWPWLHTRLIKPAYAHLIEQSTEEFTDEPGVPGLMALQEVKSAQSGVALFGSRPTSDGAATVSFVAAPMWTAGRVDGTIIVEETTNSILAARNHVFERLFSWLLIAVLPIAGVLIVYPLWLSARLCKLRNEIEHIVDVRSHALTIAASAKAGDEIGDLSRSFSDLLGRLAEAAVYREQIASRLSHELRTPIAIVRSSLENLHEPLSENERGTYLRRAQGGLDRLSHILSRMMEASRLDQSIFDAERAKVDLCALLKSSVEGYKLAYRDRQFSLRLPDGPCRRFVAPDLIVQMLDKLIANAHEFATPNTVIDILLHASSRSVTLRVVNAGPLPREGNNASLFEPMVSVRPGKRSTTPHLGLGLYVVRLIAEFHGGEARLSPRDDGLGAVVTVKLRNAPGAPDDDAGSKKRPLFAFLGMGGFRRSAGGIRNALRWLGRKQKKD